MDLEGGLLLRRATLDRSSFMVQMVCTYVSMYVFRYVCMYVFRYVRNTMLEIKKKCSLNIILLNVLPYEL